MTTRHTITHADKVYRGNAFLDGYSPDGRRGLEMPHVYVKEYGAIASYDADGIVSSYVSTGAYANMLTNTASVCKGALVTTALMSEITLDVPRNILLTASNAESKRIIITGRDEYGEVMVESIYACAAGVTSGKKAFKVLTSITTTVAFASTISIGTGNRIGLPFKLPNKGKFLGLTIDGGATGGYTLVAAHATTANGSSSNADADVRGTIATTTVPDSAKLFTITMLVDGSTRNKAFGVPQATVAT